MLDNIICKKLFARKKNVFFQKISYITLPFGMVRKEKKSNLIYQKTTEQVSKLGNYLILEMRIQILKIQLLIL